MADPIAGATGGQGSGQPPHDDSTTPVAPVMPKFVIEKSAETTIFGQSTETAAAEVENREMTEPVIHAEENSDSILMSTSTQVGPPVATMSEPLTESPDPISDIKIETPTQVQTDSITPESSVSLLTASPTTDDLFSHFEEPSSPL